MLKSLNDNAGAYQAIFSGLLLIATIIYVYINSKMNKEMKRARIREETPMLSVRFVRIKGASYNLVIENISDVNAYNVRFDNFPSLLHNKFNDLKENDERVFNSSELGFVKYGIKYLAPKQAYETIFLDLMTINRECDYKEYSFKLKYEGHFKALKWFKNVEKVIEYEIPILVDISSFHNTMVIIGT